jgi:hypothetical protein
MDIELTKSASGGSILKCIRADGSIAWQRNQGRNGMFFALHDLRHYAAESVLRADKGFFGLIAAGWEVTDTTGKGSRGKIPDETIAIEHLVGLLDAEGAGGDNMTARELNGYAVAYAAQHNRPSPAAISEQSLAKIRGLTMKLHAEWMALPSGEKMRLFFRDDL